jgi:AcrR family transcriptional regulator
MREEIVLAAAGAFARRGFRSTTMTEIAAASGYTAASLYTYFKSKDEIFVALFQQLIADMLRTFDEPVPSGLDFGQRVELLLLRQYEMAEHRRDAFLLLISNMSEMPKECGNPAEGHQTFLQRFAKWMSANASEKELGDTPVEDAARALMGISQVWFKEWLIGVRKGRLTAAAPLVTKLFLHGVSGGSSR